MSIESKDVSNGVLEIVNRIDVQLKTLDTNGKGEQQFHLKPNGQLFNTKLGLFVGVNGANVKAHSSPLGADTWEIGNIHFAYKTRRLNVPLKIIDIIN